MTPFGEWKSFTNQLQWYLSSLNMSVHIDKLEPIWTLVCSLSLIFSEEKGLGECMCQKVMQSAHHAATAQTSSVLWGLSVCLWGGGVVLNEIGWRGGLQRAEGKSHYGLLQSLEFLRSPPLHACYIVKPKTAAGLIELSHVFQGTGIVQHYAR